MNSRAKGARGERDAVAAIRELWGIEAERGQQRSGSPDSPDVKHSIRGVHIEVKRLDAPSRPFLAVEGRAAVAQAAEDAGPRVPVVMHRQNRGGWLLTLPMERAADFAEALLEAIEEAEQGRDQMAADLGLAEPPAEGGR